MNSGIDEPQDAAASGSRQRKRVPYFLRPKQPHDWRWVVGGIGKTLIVLGLMMFAFVGYQLFGTGIETARAQNKLGNQFEDLLGATTTSTVSPVTTVPSDTLPPATSSTVPTAPAGLPIANGDPVARLRIDRIGVDVYVVEGVQVEDLKKGPGHFRETPMPGQLGNAAIAGHRTTYGAPFGDLDELAPGDLIQVDTVAGTFVYSVTGTVIVSPSEYAAVIPTVDPTIATLTLATCHPEYTSRERMVVQAVLVPEMSGQVMAPPSNTQPVSPDATLPTESLPTESLPTESGSTSTSVPVTVDTTPTPGADELDGDVFAKGWFSDTSAIPHAIGWGLLLLAVGVGAYLVGRASKRLYVSFLVGFVPFVVVMYFFFENVNRLLPPSL